ncbi:MAG: hypothetical protein JRJ29_12985 [Deltaproteobacteria bacterium]|nr:hypothetical protein [Deltaproteobacteria bacterium]
MPRKFTIHIVLSMLPFLALRFVPGVEGRGITRKTPERKERIYKADPRIQIGW